MPELVSLSLSPYVSLSHLDDLWFQVAGTRCNLACHHCFISCGPSNHAFGFLSRQRVRQFLDESRAHGVREYYFTGGEPFLHPEMVAILIDTLAQGPATVLTNATVLRDAWLERLAEAERESRYSLEFRVSIDGSSPETNDPIRGAGTFERAMHGVERLVRFGFLPIITAARTWPEGDDAQVVQQFTAVLRERGYARPRLKILPTLRIGAEIERTCGYQETERVDHRLMADYDASQLVCEHSRMVTDRGVHVCPILIESPESLLGQDLDAARRPFAISHGACFTCYLYGAICSNPR